MDDLYPGFVSAVVVRNGTTGGEQNVPSGPPTRGRRLHRLRFQFQDFYQTQKRYFDGIERSFASIFATPIPIPRTHCHINTSSGIHSSNENVSGTEQTTNIDHDTGAKCCILGRGSKDQGNLLSDHRHSSLCEYLLPKHATRVDNERTVRLYLCVFSSHERVDRKY